MYDTDSLFGQVIVLWLAGSNGKRVGHSHRVAQTLDGFSIVTRCGLGRQIWGRGITTERTLAVPARNDTEVTCSRCKGEQ